LLLDLDDDMMLMIVLAYYGRTSLLLLLLSCGRFSPVLLLVGGDGWGEGRWWLLRRYDGRRTNLFSFSLLADLGLLIFYNLPSPLLLN